MDWHLEVKIQAGDKQCSSCLLIQERMNNKILNTLTYLNHVEHDTCTMLGRNIKTRYFWLILILRLKKDWHSIRLDRMQLFSKEHFQLIVFQKLWDWKLEKSCMRNHTCLLERHQRSHCDTITIGPEGKFNLGSTVVQQPEGKVVRQSRGEVQHATFSQLTRNVLPTFSTKTQTNVWSIGETW